MDRLFSLAIILLIGLTASLSVKPAKASWYSSWDTPTSGYCASAPPGYPPTHYLVRDVSRCPENLKRNGNVLKRQKPKSALKPKSTAKPKSAPKPKSTAIVGCSATPVRYHYRNETVQSLLTAKAGERCVLTRKPSPGASIGALKIIAQPRNGSVQLLEGYSVAYTPRSGFKGNDHFIQRVCGDTNLEGTKCSNIQYAVTVY